MRNDKTINKSTNQTTIKTMIVLVTLVMVILFIYILFIYIFKTVYFYFLNAFHRLKLNQL